MMIEEKKKSKTQKHRFVLVRIKQHLTKILSETQRRMIPWIFFFLIFPFTKHKMNIAVVKSTSL